MCGNFSSQQNTVSSQRKRDTKKNAFSAMHLFLENWIQEAPPILKPKRHAGQTMVLQVWQQSCAYTVYGFHWAQKDFFP